MLKQVPKSTMVVVAVLLIIGLVFPMLPIPMYGYIVSIIIQALLFVYLANSFNIISGLTGLFSMGHAAFFGVGAYGVALMLTTFYNESLGIAGSYVVGLLLGVVVAVLLGLVVAWIATKLKGLFFSMATLALCEVLRNFALQWTSVTGGQMGRVIPKELSIGSTAAYYIILIMCVVGFFITFLLKNSKPGRMFMAIRENEALAASLGVNLKKWTYVAVIISSILGALGGAFYPFYLSHIEPTGTFDYAVTMSIIIVCIAGGSGTVLGPLLGGIVVLINESTRAILTNVSSGATSFASLSGIIYGLILLLIIQIIPGGLISIKDVIAERREGRRLKAPSTEP
jgi:branched-chain amino acid transport system permease protein